jgi:riboflavin kinase
VTLNTLKALCVEGKVFHGSGEGAKFIKLPWVKQQIAEKLGFVPYPGTLNMKLAKNSVKAKKWSKKAKSIEISPITGFCRGRCFKACLMDDVECAIVIPEIANYPEDVLEVVAPINLRQKFMLKDEDIVKVKIML